MPYVQGYNYFLTTTNAAATVTTCYWQITPSIGTSYNNVNSPLLPEMTSAAPTRGARRPSHAEQDRIAARRMEQQVEWRRRLHQLTDGREDEDEITEEDFNFVGRDMNAIRLARDIMGIEAIRQLAQEGHVDVPSKLLKPYRGYRLRPWRRIGILARNEFGDDWIEMTQSLCIHPDDTYPPGDELAALWLELNFDEENLLARANTHTDWADPTGACTVKPNSIPYACVLARTLLEQEVA